MVDTNNVNQAITNSLVDNSVSSSTDVSGKQSLAAAQVIHTLQKGTQTVQQIQQGIQPLQQGMQTLQQAAQQSKAQAAANPNTHSSSFLWAIFSTKAQSQLTSAMMQQSDGDLTSTLAQIYMQGSKYFYAPKGDPDFPQGGQLSILSDKLANDKGDASQMQIDQTQYQTMLNTAQNFTSRMEALIQAMQSQTGTDGTNLQISIAQLQEFLQIMKDVAQALQK